MRRLQPTNNHRHRRSKPPRRSRTTSLRLQRRTSNKRGRAAAPSSQQRVIRGNLPTQVQAEPLRHNRNKEGHRRRLSNQRLSRVAAVQELHRLVSKVPRTRTRRLPKQLTKPKSSKSRRIHPRAQNPSSSRRNPRTRRTLIHQIRLRPILTRLSRIRQKPQTLLLQTPVRRSRT